MNNVKYVIHKQIVIIINSNVVVKRLYVKIVIKI